MILVLLDNCMNKYFLNQNKKNCYTSLYQEGTFLVACIKSRNSGLS